MDYKKAFVSVITAAVLEALRDQGRGKAYLQLLDYTHKGCRNRIILRKQGDQFPVEKVVGQGKAISLKQLIPFLEEVLTKLG